MGIRAFLLSLLVCLAVAAPVRAEEPLKRVTFLPQWSPQAQFAGYYVAYKKGIYRKYGIEVDILAGGAHRPSSEYLANGNADFVTLWLSSALQSRSGGIKLVNIGQVVQRSALLLVTKKTSGITRPRDMDGRKVGLWGGDFEIQPKAFFRKQKINVTIVPQSFSVNLFLRGGVDVASAMWYNEYHTILNSGVNPEELTVFFFHELGLNFPEDGIYTLEETLRRDPDLACAFVKASLEGWLYAFSHPEEAVDIVLEYAAAARVPANRVHQRWMLAKMKELILPKAGDEGTVGVLKQSDFMLVGRELKDAGLIRDIPPFETFYQGCVQHGSK
ncbi:MAG: NMT1/THI5 like protein [Syntrophorhabdaceae bacterium PtaU1.Bin034]|nr:MAG: NMT1/THI5 like protein [Syntrophorhabdaceae bacterium PtaU1.Bin034]